MISHTMKIGLTGNYDILLGSCIDLNVLWKKLSKEMQLVQEDVIIRNQLDEAVASIL